jgi:hypothetical protein
VRISNPTNIKIDLKEIKCQDLDWFKVVQVRSGDGSFEKSTEPSGSIEVAGIL